MVRRGGKRSLGNGGKQRVMNYWENLWNYGCGNMGSCSQKTSGFGVEVIFYDILPNLEMNLPSKFHGRIKEHTDILSFAYSFRCFNLKYLNLMKIYPEMKKISIWLIPQEVKT